MRFVGPTFRPIIAAIACCGFVCAAGCCNGLICSQRIADFGPPSNVNGAAENAGDCGCGGSVLARLHCPVHSGAHSSAESGHSVATAQHTMRPPHPRFLPVPTRPVFAPRPEYEPPHPLGLVPVPHFGEPTPAILDEHEPPPLVAPESALPLPSPHEAPREAPRDAPRDEPNSGANEPDRSAAKARTSPTSGSARTVSVRILDEANSSPSSAKPVQRVTIR